jgi:hypothetical protein
VASMPPRPACVTHQPRTITGMSGAAARITRRDVVRSDSAPTTGLASSDAIAPAAITTENSTALSAGCSDWTCSGSTTWIGA